MFIIKLLIVCVILTLPIIIMKYFINDFINQFSKCCHNYIEEKDKEYEKQEQLNKNLRKWLF